MAIAAKKVIQDATRILQDQTSIRWPANELVRWLNAGQREVMLHRPDAFNTLATVTLVAGTKQTLPAGGTKLISIPRNNSTSSKKAVRMVAREILDAQMPGWHSLTGADEIVHYMYDVRDPKTFWVYPPATTSAKLDVNYSASPSDVTEPADGSDYDDVTGNINVDDIYANALLDYVLYRAYLKDSTYAGNPQRSANHYAAFAASLGIEVKATIAVAPGVTPTGPASPT